MKAPIPAPGAAVAAALGITLAVVPVLGPASAEAQEPTDSETRRILAEIASIKELLYGSADRNNERAITTLQSALASPKATYDLYMESLKALEFTEAGKRESDWREWRDRNEERLSSTEHVAALQLQVRYLILTIRAASGPDEEKALKAVLPDLMSYLDDLATGYEALDDQAGTLRGSVLDSTFAKRLKLDVTLTAPARWSRSPADLASIYEQAILPMARESGNLRALETAWDKRIAQEGKLFASRGGGGGAPRAPGFGGGRPFRFPGRGDERDREREERREDARQRDENEEEFSDVKLPQLQWSKSRDLLIHGADRIASLRAMSAQIRDHLDHPDARKWLSELEELARQGTYDSLSETEEASPARGPGAEPPPAPGAN